MSSLWALLLLLALGHAQNSTFSIVDPAEMGLLLEDEEAEKELGFRQQDANFGDLEFLTEDRTAPLLWREVVVNDRAPQTRLWRWVLRVPANRITMVRAYNFGRAIGLVQRIRTDVGTAEIITQVRANEQMRLFVEVFGR